MLEMRVNNHCGGNKHSSTVTILLLFPTLPTQRFVADSHLRNHLQIIFSRFDIPINKLESENLL